MVTSDSDTQTTSLQNRASATARCCQQILSSFVSKLNNEKTTDLMHILHVFYFI